MSKEKREAYYQVYQNRLDASERSRRLNNREIAKEVVREQDMQDNKSDMRDTGKKMLKWVAHGFSNIAQSLNNPSEQRRMRIAQMPNRRSEMDIVRKPNLTRLMDPTLRYKDIRGRIVKNRKRF